MPDGQNSRLLHPSSWSPRALAGALFVLFAAVLLGVGFALLSIFTGGNSGPKLHTLPATRSCLQDKGVATAAPPRDDFVASTALGGALRARLAANSVTIDFGTSVAGALGIERAYRRFAPRRFPLDSVMLRRDDVVLLWERQPAADELREITRCLK